MKKKIFKSFLIFLVAAAFVFTTSCKKKPTDDPVSPDDPNTPVNPTDPTKKTFKINYVLNGGVNPDSAKTEYTEGTALRLPEPTKEGSTFAGWYDNEQCTGSAIAYFDKNTTGDKTLYAKWTEATSTEYQPKWELNSINFNGGGMKILIKVLPVAEFDPFDSSFSGEKKAVRQAHMSRVESAYNVDIQYSAWDNSAAWGPQRVEFIKSSYLDGSFADNNVYVVNIASQWIPTLVKARTLASLYNTSTKKGIFGDYGYEQNATINESVSVNKNVYGYSSGTARPDYFLYYNYDLAKETGLDDPAELWFRGEWTWSTFKDWVTKAQTNIVSKVSDAKVIDGGAAGFFIGACAGQGNKLVNVRTATVSFASSACAGIFDQMRELYQGGYWNTAHGTHDVTTQFTGGKTIFADGSLWFLKEATRWDPNVVNFKIGVVPYPANDANVMTPYTEPYTYLDSQGNEVKVEEPLLNVDGEVVKTKAGEPIYGLNLTESTKFFIPFTGTSCYSIMNFEPTANGFTQSICFKILYDLFEGQGEDPAEQIKLTADEAYYAYLNKKFDARIFSDVVMSVQNNSKISYFELMEVLSMTVGDGSHFGPNGFWPVAAGIIKSADSASTKLREIKDVYQQALEQLGI